MSNSTEGRTAPPATIHHLLPRSQGIAYAAAFVVEGLFTIIGNLVVLAVFGKNRQLRQRKSHWLLVNQAVADLLAGLIVVPLTLYYLTLDFNLWQSYSDVYVSPVVEAITLLPTFASLFNLLLIALERTYATFRPTKHRVISARNYRVAIAAVWCLPVLLPIFPTIARRLKIFSLRLHVGIVAGAGCGMFLLVVSGYASIWMKLKRRVHIHPQNDLRAARAERKLTVSVFLVTTASFFTYLAGIIVTTVAAVSYDKNAMSYYSTSHARTCGRLLVCANFFINPIIYSFKMPGFRRAAVRLICGNRPRTTNTVLPLQTVTAQKKKMKAL